MSGDVRKFRIKGLAEPLSYEEMLAYVAATDSHNWKCDWCPQVSQFGGWVTGRDGAAYYFGCPLHAPLVGGRQADRLPQMSLPPISRKKTQQPEDRRGLTGEQKV